MSRALNGREYPGMERAQLERELEAMQNHFDTLSAKGLFLDMSRGKPSSEQLDLSVPLLCTLDDCDFLSEDGFDVRNYGEHKGISEARRLFSQLLGLLPEQILVGGNSSINLICDALKRCYINGSLPGYTPWSKLNNVKIICPVPGYDWHWHICDTFGAEMMPVNMLEDGPDMDEVERIVASDSSVKAMFNIPMYSNPSGVTYSDQTVERLAKMPTAAEDFRLIWDNAYCVHHLYLQPRDHLSNIYEACEGAGNPDRVLIFSSTSKITMAGSGISAIAGSVKNIEYAAGLIMYQLVCYDKVNQLRHVRFLQDRAHVEAHMERHAAILRPKFQAVLEALEKNLGHLGIAQWSNPRGGYFICFNSLDGCAGRIVDLCAQAGVTLTPAGAPFPHGIDPRDNTIRLAPSYPALEELEQAMEIFCVAVRLASVERLIAAKTCGSIITLF